MSMVTVSCHGEDLAVGYVAADPMVDLLMHARILFGITGYETALYTAGGVPLATFRNARDMIAPGDLLVLR